MVELHSVNLIVGLMFGVQHEQIDEDNYLIVSLGLVEIILIW